jgi:hypothetical protein
MATPNLSAFQRDNLIKLLAHLMSLPDDYKYLDMRHYQAVVTDKRELVESVDVQNPKMPGECGTVACAVGHGPAAGVPVTSKDRGWYAYAERCFVGTSHDSYDFYVNFVFIFDGDWSGIDNSVKGVCARIGYFLTEGLPPMLCNSEDAEYLSEMFDLGEYDDVVTKGWAAAQRIMAERKEVVHG